MINPFAIFKDVEQHYHLPKGSTCEGGRTRMKSQARAVAAKLCRTLTNYSFTELATFFNNESSSIVYMVRRVNETPELFNVYNEILKEKYADSFTKEEIE